MKNDDSRIELITNYILKNWLVAKVDSTSQGYLVFAQYALPIWACPRCDVINPRLQKRGTREEIIVLPITWLRIKTLRQRYQCQQCGCTFWEPISYQR